MPVGGRVQAVRNAFAVFSRVWTRSEVPWFAALAAAVFGAAYRTLGTSPTVWIDTLLEDSRIESCLRDNHCTVVGPGATIGIYHSAGYLHWRALLGWLGLTPDGVYVLLLAMSASGVLLLALVVRRLDSRAAAAIAALIMVASNGVPTQVNVISDVAPVPFLGAVFLGLALAATARPGLVMSAALGILAGVMSNVYATGLLCGLSAVWIVLLLPQRRLEHVVVVVVTFAVSTFVIAPGTWLVDGRILLSHALIGNGHAMLSRSVFSIPVVQLTGLAAVAWCAAAIGYPPLRARLDVAAAIILPLFVPLAGGGFFGVLDVQDKYCAHVLAAVALTLSIAGVTIAQAIWLRGARLRNRTARGSELWGEFEIWSPLVAVMMLVSGYVSWQQGEPSDFTYRDLVSAEQYLGTERGWSWSRASRNLKSPDDVVRQAALHWVERWPEQGKENDLERAFLVKVLPKMVPESIPPGLVVLASTARSKTLLQLSCSWIDWRSYRVCVSDSEDSPETCTQSGIPELPRADADTGSIPGMPPVDAHNPPRRTMTIHVPLKPRKECPEEWIYMPRMPRVCPGRVVGAAGVEADIARSGTSARLKWLPGSSQPEVSLRWNLGRPECSVEYRGYPPFFVEGDPASASLLNEVLRSPYR